MVIDQLTYKSNTTVIITVFAVFMQDKLN